MARARSARCAAQSLSVEHFEKGDRPALKGAVIIYRKPRVHLGRVFQQFRGQLGLIHPVQDIGHLPLAGSSRNKQRHFDVLAGHAGALNVRAKPAVWLDGSADIGNAVLPPTSVAIAWKVQDCGLPPGGLPNRSTCTGGIIVPVTIATTFRLSQATMPVSTSSGLATICQFSDGQLPWASE